MVKTTIFKRVTPQNLLRTFFTDILFFYVRSAYIAMYAS